MNYVIINESDLVNVDLSQVGDDVPRCNVAGTQAILKYSGAMPSSISALTLVMGPLTHAQARAEMIKPEWNE